MTAVTPGGAGSEVGEGPAGSTATQAAKPVGVPRRADRPLGSGSGGAVGGREGAATEQADSLIMSVGEAAEALGISRTLAYQLVSRQELPSLRFGGRIWIPRRGLERLTEAPGDGIRAAAHRITAAGDGIPAAGGGQAEGGGPGAVPHGPCPVPSAPRAMEPSRHDVGPATQLTLFQPTPPRP
ncbi:MAG TPA: helix-turn-helix domain-containing protein [Acidimicrobiia bacterium]|nr:helix-turn-helix domain-containing protein [Acidimicrobiia bacterium]